MSAAAPGAAKDHTGQAVELIDRGPCPLCGAGAARRELVHDFDRIPVVRCGACGFMFAAQVFSAAATARYYAKDWGSLWHRRGQEINARVNAAVLPMLADFSRIESILDVGCGYGFLLAALRALQGGAKFLDSLPPRIVGVEVSAGEAEFARKTLGVDVRTGLLSAAGLKPGSFDAVLSFEVIEHTLEPRKFVEELVAHVRPGGTVIIGTDNFGAPPVKKTGAEFPKWIPHTHVSLFDAPSLRRVMTEAGLTITKEASFTTWETALRARRMGARPPRPAREVWNLDHELKSEMNRAPKLVAARLFFNPWWLRLTASRRADDGAMMWISGTKQA
ncbi:hypothetical protein BH11PLA1_BH11PLA1_15150 [soil metagenome]